MKKRKIYRGKLLRRDSVNLEIDRKVGSGSLYGKMLLGLIIFRNQLAASRITTELNLYVISNSACALF